MIGSNDETLINKKCVPCHGGISALTPDEAQKKLGLAGRTAGSSSKTARPSSASSSSRTSTAP